MIVSGSDKSQMSCGLVLVWEEQYHTKFNNITHGQTDGQSDFLGFLLKPKQALRQGLGSCSAYKACKSM